MRKFLQKLKNAENKVVGINQRNLDFVYPYNPRKHFPLANDKALSKTILEGKGIPVPETYCIIEQLAEIKKKLELIKDKLAFVIKPANGSGGNGILILFRDSAGKLSTPSGKPFNEAKLRHHIASILYGVFSFGNADKAIVEYCLTPHDFLKKIYNQGIPDFRVLVFKGDAIMAMLRVPTKSSGGKANLHQGALGIGVDMDRACLTEGLYHNKYVANHPDSGYQFAGLEIPYWQEVLKISKEAAQVVPLQYLGVDIILDADLGPLIIEINARPGLQIQNINKTGLLELINNK